MIRPTDDTAERTLAVVQRAVDWLWPYWLERQLDPRSAAFLPLGSLRALPNGNQRNWTTVGTVSSATKGIVDPRGLLTPRPGGWSLDWWIGAEDRWHFPSREAAVRQQLVGETPVVETAMRIPGGDAVQRVYGVPDGLAVMEITNATPTPIAVGLALRPYNPVAVAVIERLALDDRTVMIDGRPALLLAKRPQRMAASTLEEGDAVHKITAEDLATELPDGQGCEAGLATATFVFPLAHRQTMRVVAPLSNDRPARRFAAARRRADPLPELSAALPDSDAVVRSWQAQTSSRGMRLVLPEGRLASAVEANRRYLLLFHEGPEVVSGPFTDRRFSFRDAFSLLSAFDRYGFHRESAEVLASFPDRQRRDGSFSDARHEPGATGAALAAMAEHWRLTGSLDAIDAEAVVKGAGRIERARPTARPDEADFWSLRGLLDGAAMLRALGADPLADQCDRWAASKGTELDASMALVADSTPAASRRRVHPDVLDNLIACSALRLFAADHPAIVATAQVIRDRFGVGRAVHHGIAHTGLGTSLTLQLASVELASGDRTALERLGWLLEVASPTFAWPEAIHPGLGTGCQGDGHDGRTTADFLSFVRQLLVREIGNDGLAICSMLPDAWIGQSLEVHDAPTHFGTLSFALRYHGDRPALLWDLNVRNGVGPVLLTAPGLDPAWSTTEPKGETLLAAAPTPPGDLMTVDVEGSFS